MAAPHALSASAFGVRQAPSRDAVRQLCQESFSSPPAALGPLARRACPGLAAAPEEAAQLVSALHNLTRHVVYRGLTKPEDILALFPENFHQNLKNLLTKIILENQNVTPGWCGLQNGGHQDLFRQHQQNGSPYLPAAVEDSGRRCLINPGHYVGRSGKDPGPAFCCCKQVNSSGHEFQLPGRKLFSTYSSDKLQSSALCFPS
uniref:COMM domain containing 9 n=1 Tax=Nothoprocta perdicaria TaxID=30464 RepID=A0A8C6ZPQ0_NOTPE